MSEKAKLQSAWWVDRGRIHLDISGDVRARTYVSEEKSAELAVSVLWHNPLVAWPFLAASGGLGVVVGLLISLVMR